MIYVQLRVLLASAGLCYLPVQCTLRICKMTRHSSSSDSAHNVTDEPRTTYQRPVVATKPIDLSSLALVLILHPNKHVQENPEGSYFHRHLGKRHERGIARIVPPLTRAA